MSYKVGDKFVIEIEETICGYGNNPDDIGHITEPLHRIKGFNTLVFDAYGLDKLQKINPKLKIEDIDDMLAEHDLKKEAYEKGLNDAWELARKVADISTTSERADMFGYYCNGITITDVLRDFTPQQALAKIEAYEESKVFKVGDVVRAYRNHEYVVIATSEEMPNKQPLLRSLENTKNVCFCTDDGMEKTGRHIDIEHLLEQIRGDE